MPSTSELATSERLNEIRQRAQKEIPPPWEWADSFTSHARQDIPYLLDLVASMQAENQRLQEDYATVERYLDELKTELGFRPNTALGLTLDYYKEKVEAPWKSEVERLRTEKVWQPIETAPRNGKTILGFCDTKICSQGVVKATWSQRKGFWVSPDGAEGYDLTHWMSLPNSPKENS